MLLAASNHLTIFLLFLPNCQVCCTATGHPSIIIEGDSVQCQMIPLNTANRGSNSDIGISEYMDSYSRLAAAILKNAQFPPSKRFLNYQRYLMPTSQFASEEPYFDSEKLNAAIASQAPSTINDARLWATPASDASNQKTVCIEVYEK